jgi:hypothetical protein
MQNFPFSDAWRAGQNDGQNEQGTHTADDAIAMAQAYLNLYERDNNMPLSEKDRLTILVVYANGYLASTAD